MIRKVLSTAKQAAARALLSVGRRRFFRRRLRGEGLEIGALHDPWSVPRGVTVRYVDRLTTDELRRHYPELAAHPFARVDVVDDGEVLSSVPDSSQDFVIASHVLEHCQNPIGALSTWLRVVRPGGAVLLVVPDKRFTFDRSRPVTPLDHVIRDAAEGPHSSRREHYREWAEQVDGAAPEDVESRALALESSAYSIHFHAWDLDALAELLEHVVSRGDATLVGPRRNRDENLALLLKR